MTTNLNERTKYLFLKRLLQLFLSSRFVSLKVITSEIVQLYFFLNFFLKYFFIRQMQILLPCFLLQKLLQDDNDIWETKKEFSSYGSDFIMKIKIIIKSICLRWVVINVINVMSLSLCVLSFWFVRFNEYRFVEKVLKTK